MMLEIVLAAVLTGGVTAGWENINPDRREYPISEVIWSAPTEGLEVQRIGGAEGEVRFVAGKIFIEKTNDRGVIRVLAPNAKFDDGRHVRFSADIVECHTRSVEKAMGGLTASNDGKDFPDFDKYRPERWFGNGGNYMRQMVNTAPGMSYRKYAHGLPAKGELIPAIYVSGEASSSVWVNWRAEYNDTAQADWNRHLETRLIPDRRSEMEPLESFEQALAADTEHTSEIRTVNGRSVFVVDGKITPPIVYRESRMYYPPPHYLMYAGRALHDAGVKVGAIEVNFAHDPSKIQGYWTKDGFDVKGAVERIRGEMRIAGPQVFLLAFGLNAYPEFSSEHPDECWIKDDGSVAYGTYGSVSKEYDSGGDYGEKKTWPWVSYASKSYRAAIKENLTRLIEELKRTGLSKRIIGFHLLGFHDGQFAMPFPDYSESVKAEYAKYLKEDNPGPEFEYFSVQMGFRTQEEFARHIKKEFGKPMVGVRWCMTPFGGGTGAHDITAFTRSDAIDVIVPQTAYRQRQPALATSCNLPCATFHENRKMLWYEFDHRNYAAYDTWAKSIIAVKGLGSAEDKEQWAAIDRKHHGMTISLGMGNWYYDMGGGWLRDKPIVDGVADVYRFYDDLLVKTPDPWHPDVVWIIDERSICLYNRKGYPSVGLVRNMVAGARQPLGGSGVPFEVRLIDDFIRKPQVMKKYKAALLAGFLVPDDSRKKLMDDLVAAGMKIKVESAKGITAEDFNSFAKSAGAFVASEPGVEVDMNGDFMSLHAIVPGKHRINLPFPAKVVNVKSGAEEQADESGFDVTMSAGETCWFRLYRR